MTGHEFLPETVAQLWPVLKGLHIASPNQFEIDGVVHDAATYAASGWGNTFSPRSHSVMGVALQHVLYTICYVRRAVAAQHDHDGATSFHLALSRANTSRSRWDPGWRPYWTGPGQDLFVTKAGAIRTAAPGEFALGNAPYTSPASVYLLVRREMLVGNASFYMAQGETLGDFRDERSLARFYLNTTPQSAVQTLWFLTRELNRFLVPFRLKTILEPNHYDRADATVLYVGTRFCQICAHLLAGMCSQEKPELGPVEPLFTRKIRDGIGFAEDPGNGESFGLHRCRLVAEGILDAWAAGEQSPSARLEAAHRRFVANGCDPVRPYLNPGRVDWFDVPET